MLITVKFWMLINKLPWVFGILLQMSAVGVRRGKAALFQWVQVPPG